MGVSEIYRGLLGLSDEGLIGRLEQESEVRLLKKGQLLIEVDLKAVEEAGLKTITPMVVCNTDNYPTFQTKVDRDVTNADVVIQLAK